MEYYLYYALRNVTLIAPAVVDPNFELRGKGLLALPAFLPSVIVFFTQNNGGRPSWAPPLDPPLSGSFKGWITSMVASFVSYFFLLSFWQMCLFWCCLVPWSFKPSGTSCGNNRRPKGTWFKYVLSNCILIFNRSRYFVIICKWDKFGEKFHVHAYMHNLINLA